MYNRLIGSNLYIHELPAWPIYGYDLSALVTPLSNVLVRQGELFGRLKALGFDDLQDAKLDAIATEVVKSSEIEGVPLDQEVVRSSVARHLGIDAGGIPSGDHYIEGIVEMSLDASERSNAPLDEERLFGWHAALFPTGRGALGRLRVGEWRDDALGPMQVVSRANTRKEVVHFQAPPANRIPEEMRRFLEWFESDDDASGILKAGIAHLWFETIHPFEDGNGRIGRAILDMALARADQRPYRCYSVSVQIRKERDRYYKALESAQKSGLDYTAWLEWYLGCLARSIESASSTIEGAMARTRFWQAHAQDNFNERQRTVISRMLMGWEGNMTNKKWQKITSCSDATASRDLDELVRWEVFQRQGEGRSVRYQLLSGVSK